MTQRKSNRRIVVDVDNKFHHKVKEEALKRGLTITHFVVIALIEKIKNDEHF